MHLISNILYYYITRKSNECRCKFESFEEGRMLQSHNINHLKCDKDITVDSVITFLTGAIEDVQNIF